MARRQSVRRGSPDQVWDPWSVGAGAEWELSEEVKVAEAQARSRKPAAVVDRERSGPAGAAVVEASGAAGAAGASGGSDDPASDGEEQNRVKSVKSEISKRQAKRTSQWHCHEDLFAEDYVLPLGDLLRGLHATERGTTLRYGPVYLLYVLCFVVAFSTWRPVATTFEVHSGVLQSLGERTIGNSSRTDGAPRVVFTNISNFGEFWSWTETVLFPQVYQGSEFNGLSGGQGFAIAKYNMVITPVRFRQLRSKEGKCRYDEDGHSLARPCWTYYSQSTQEESTRLGSSSSSGTVFVEDGLSSLMGNREVGEFYAEGGHVVDLVLNESQARGTLQAMISERWADEWTRVMAVEVNTYNPAYDVATAFRFQVDNSLGGRLEPYVEARSCPLSPYRGFGGASRAFFQVLWALGYVLYVIGACLVWWERGQTYINNGWGLLEVACLVLQGIVGVSMAAYVGKSDTRDRFRQRHDTDFQDLYSLCDSFDFAASWAAFSVVWGTVHAFMYFRLYPRFRLIWETLAHSMAAVLPFGAVLFLVITGFAFAGYWLFGTQVAGFHTWLQSLGILFRSLIVGFAQQKGSRSLLTEMQQTRPFMGKVWAVSWAIVSKLVTFSLIVAIMVRSFAYVNRRTTNKLEIQKEFPPHSWVHYFWAGFLKMFVDPTVREPAESYLKEQAAWRIHLEMVDRDLLEALVLKRVSRGAKDFEIADTMQLFPDEDDLRSYRRAAAWMKGLAQHLGVKMRRLRKPSTALEVRRLMGRVMQLEEECLGLTLQLKGRVPSLHGGEPI